MHIKWKLVDIQTKKHWSLIGRSITAPPPVLSRSSILRPPSSPCAFIPIEEKIRRAFKKILFQLSILI
jgi:hypothetical protein